MGSMWEEDDFNLQVFRLRGMARTEGVEGITPGLDSGDQILDFEQMLRE